MIHPRHVRLAIKLRREVAEREAQLYGARLDDMILLRKRGFAVHIEGSGAARRFRVDNRLLSGTELRAVAARERRLRKLDRKGNGMARIRTIKPEFFTSDDICALSPLARLLYVGLWCEADREGRLVWTPGVLKRRYLPDDSCDIEALCDELATRGLVRLYGEGLACIPSFARHQHVNVREAQSKLPPPPGEVSTQFPQGREREEGKEGEGTERTHAQALPDGWRPDEEDLAWAAGARPDLDGAALEAESERFRNHALANRRTAHRWGPAWRMWISKAHEPARHHGGKRNRPDEPGENLGERDSDTQWRARLARYRPGKFWLEGDWGPRPESGRSRVPAEMLAEWRRRQEAA